MSDFYELTGSKTYATAKRVFREGVKYPASEVAELLGNLNDAGHPYFMDSATPGTKEVFRSKGYPIAPVESEKPVKVEKPVEAEKPIEAIKSTKVAI